MCTGIKMIKVITQDRNRSYAPLFFFFFKSNVFILRSYSYESLTNGAKRTAYLRGRSRENANKVATYRKRGLLSKGGPNSPITDP